MDRELKKEARGLNLDFDALKSGGFIKQTQKDLFTVRLRCPGGKLTSAKLRKAAEIADKYGKGEVHNSARQSIEIPYIHHQYFEEIVEALKEVDWSVASCGPRIRVPTACAGCTWNPNGLMDSHALCAEVDKKYFGTATGHHKFKISFAGCPIDCSRSRDMDLGFQGIVEPGLVDEMCNACGLCVATCDEGALVIVDGLPVRDTNKCNYCGDCIKVCAFDAMIVARTGWLARVGGKHGKHPIYSWEIAKFLSDQQCLDLIDPTMEWYKTNGQGRERIGAVINRLGIARFIDEVVRPASLEIIETLEDRQKFRASGNMYSE